jgi:hypothetical protein
MPRRGLSGADEAAFALLEPDGATPQKARRQQEKVSAQKTKIAGAFCGIFVLFIVGSHHSSKAAHVAGGTNTVSEVRTPAPTTHASAAAATGNEDVIVVNPKATVGAVSRLAASSSAVVHTAVKGNAGENDEDVIVVNPARAVATTGGVASQIGSNFVSHHEDHGDGAPAVVRHIAQGEDQEDHPPPPPPPSRSFMQWLGFSRKRQMVQGTTPPHDSLEVARMMATLEREVKSGRPFAPGEMGLRLAEIEELERAAIDSKQKKRDEATKLRLEEEVRLAAEKMGDHISQHLAEAEELMSTHGLRHPVSHSHGAGRYRPDFT